MKTRVTNRADRLDLIEKLLFDNLIGMRVVEIARACGVDRRTIYRDLTMLQESGVPIYQKNGRFLLSREHYSTTLRINIHEATALILAIRLVLYHASQQNPHLVSILQKLSESLPSISSHHVTFLVEMLRKSPVDPSFVKVLETITKAWGEQRVIELWCGSTKQGKVISREFATYFIEMTSDGDVYVIGYDVLAQRVRGLKLHRIVRAKLLRKTFDLPVEFNPQQYLANVWTGIEDNYADILEATDVTLHFSGHVATSLMQKRWYIKQDITRLDDDRFECTIRTTNVQKMLPWIRSLGNQVEVVKPESIRNQLIDEARQLLATYLPNNLKQATS